MWGRWKRGVGVGVAVAAVASGVFVASSSFGATNADFTGHWSLVDLVTAGPQQGQSYPWEGDWVQSGTSLTGTGGYSIVGSVSGSTVTFTTTSGGSYVATFQLTMSADGKSLSGSATDNQGRTFSVTGSGAGKPPVPETTTTTQTTSTTPTAGAAPSAPTAGLPPLPAADPDKASARIQSVRTITQRGTPDLVVIRDGKRYAAKQDVTLQKGDVIETGKDTIAAFEFLIGGRVGLNGNTRSEIVNERSEVSQRRGPRRVVLDSGRLWASPKANRAPIEIQTNGGVMGIRG